MMTRKESLTENKLESNLADKVTSIFEILSLVLLLIPFGSMALWMVLSTFLKGDYFFFFPIAMFLFFPTGVFALLIQFSRILRKRPASSFNMIMVGFSIITTVIGVFACMAVFIVTS